MQTHKKNGFPTVYGYHCGYGKEVKGHIGNSLILISLMPFENGLEVKGLGKWAQFYYEDYEKVSECIREAETEFKLRRKKLNNLLLYDFLN